MSLLGLHLLDLPIDIIALILRPLLTSANSGGGGGSASTPTRSTEDNLNTSTSTSAAPIPLCACTPSPVHPLPVLLVHPALYAVACPLFYGAANRFVLDLTGEHGGHVRRYIRAVGDQRRRREKMKIPLAVGGESDDEGQDDAHDGHDDDDGGDDGDDECGGKFLLLVREARRRVAKLEIRMDRLRGWVDEAITPLVGDMLIHGSLVDLGITLYLDETRSRSDTRNHREVFERPPLGGLLRLLGDPALRRARLHVSGRHGRAWCGYHDGECGEEGGMVEVDWGGILGEMDPEGKARAVSWR